MEKHSQQMGSPRAARTKSDDNLVVPHSTSGLGSSPIQQRSPGGSRIPIQRKFSAGSLRPPPGTKVSALVSSIERSPRTVKEPARPTRLSEPIKLGDNVLAKRTKPPSSSPTDGLFPDSRVSPIKKRSPRPARLDKSAELRGNLTHIKADPPTPLPEGKAVSNIPAQSLSREKFQKPANCSNPDSFTRNASKERWKRSSSPAISGALLSRGRQLHRLSDQDLRTEEDTCKRAHPVPSQTTDASNPMGNLRKKKSLQKIEEIPLPTRLSEPDILINCDNADKIASKAKNEKALQFTGKPLREVQEISQVSDKMRPEEPAKVSNALRPKSPLVTREGPKNSTIGTTLSVPGGAVSPLLRPPRAEVESSVRDMKRDAPEQLKSTLAHSNSRSSVEDTQARLDASRRRSGSFHEYIDSKKERRLSNVFLKPTFNASTTDKETAAETMDKVDNQNGVSLNKTPTLRRVPSYARMTNSRRRSIEPVDASSAPRVSHSPRRTREDHSDFMTRENIRLRQKVNNLERRLTETDVRIREAYDLMTTLTDEADQLREENSELRIELDATRYQRDLIAEEESKRERLVSQVQFENLALKHDISRLEDRINMLNGAINVARERLSEKSEDSRVTFDTVVRLQTLVQEMQREIGSTKETEEIEKLKGEKGILEEEGRRLRAERVRLRGKLLEMKRELMEIKEKGRR